MLGLVLDGSIAILILAALALGLRLQRHLRELRSSDGEPERLIIALDDASERSRAAIDGLRRATADADERPGGRAGAGRRSALSDQPRRAAGRSPRGADPAGAAGGATIRSAAAQARCAEAPGPVRPGGPRARSRAHSQGAAMTRLGAVR